MLYDQIHIWHRIELPMSSSSDQKKTHGDEPGFMESLDGIKKLDSDRVNLYQDLPRKKSIHPSGSRNSHQPPVGPSFADSLDPDESWFHHGLQKKIRQRILTGKLPVEAELDLHGYRSREAQAKLGEFIEQALNIGLRMVMIIHGKGYRSQGASVLRPLVLNSLKQHPGVLAYCPAQPRDGGLGASYVYLRSSKS